MRCEIDNSPKTMLLNYKKDMKAKFTFGQNELSNPIFFKKKWVNES